MVTVTSSTVFSNGVAKHLLVLFFLGITIIMLVKTVKPPVNMIRVHARTADKPACASNNMTENDDLLQKMKQIYQQQAISRKSILNDSSALTHALLHTYIVPEVFCPGLTRIGNLGDGGKWICSPFNVPRENCAIISLGTANEISFETELQRITDKRCKLVAVDKSNQTAEVIKGLESINGKFMKGTLGAVLNTTANLITLDHVMQKYGIKSIEILKIDIEGGEDQVIPPVIASQNICQILIEIHYALPKRIPFMKEIAKHGYYLFAHELNPYWQQLSEYSFIHSSCLKKYGATLLASYLS